LEYTEFDPQIKKGGMGFQLVRGGAHVFFGWFSSNGPGSFIFAEEAFFSRLQSSFSAILSA